MVWLAFLKYGSGHCVESRLQMCRGKVGRPFRGFKQRSVREHGSSEEGAAGFAHVFKVQAIESGDGPKLKKKNSKYIGLSRQGD